MIAYEIIRRKEAHQSESCLSFAGGKPILPKHINCPECKFCNQKMTFFFQIEFPEGHDWHGKIMSMFYCTKCYPSEGGNSQMASDLSEIPDYFLDKYQTNFRIFAYDSTEKCEIHSNYDEMIEYEIFELKKLRKNEYSKKTKIGGRPYWRYDDNTPKSYMESRFTFLMQIDDDWEFDKLEYAPRQVTIPLCGSTTREDDRYALFSGLPLYFFGTLDLEEPKVYLLNQK